MAHRRELTSQSFVITEDKTVLPFDSLPANEKYGYMKRINRRIGREMSEFYQRHTGESGECAGAAHANKSNR